MVRINLNEHVKFIPTPDGLAALRVNPYVTMLEPDCMGEYCLPLWIFCNVFGPYMKSGNSLVEKNDLIIGDANEHV